MSRIGRLEGHVEAIREQVTGMDAKIDLLLAEKEQRSGAEKALADIHAQKVRQASIISAIFGGMVSTGFTALGRKIGWLPIIMALIPINEIRAAPPDHTDGTLAPWFNSLTNPATGMSCCSEADGHILKDSDWRVAGDHYQIKIAGVWRDVPQQAVLDRIDNPTGGVVAFYGRYADENPSLSPVIFCLVRAVET